MLHNDHPKFVVGLLVCCLAGVLRAVPVVETYALPSVYSASTLFSLRVNDVPVPVVDYSPMYDYAHFSIGLGNSTFEITILNQSTVVNTFKISPQKHGLSSTVSADGNKITFSVPKDEYLIVKVNNLPELVLAADPLESSKPPSAGMDIFNVANSPYDANTAGNDLNTTTQAIQRAIDDASTAGRPGARSIVYIPQGLYLVGNLVLKSNIEMYLEGGAVLRFSGLREDYITHWHKDSQDRDITWWISTAFNSSNIFLHGRGTLDGNGFFSTSSEHNFACNILVPIVTTDFEVDGILTRDSGSWGVTPVRSTNLKFTNVKFFNRFDMGEDDAIDVNESSDVLIKHAIGISLDDPFSTKTWHVNQDIAVSWPGSPQPLRNVLIEDALSWTFCYAYKIGQGVCEDQSNVTVRDAVVYDAAIGLGADHKYGAAKAQTVLLENIDIEQLSYTLVGRRTWMILFSEVNTDNEFGPMVDFTFRNITVRDAGRTAAGLVGLNSTNAYIRDVTFDRVYMPGSNGMPASTLEAMNVTNVQFADQISVLTV